MSYRSLLKSHARGLLILLLVGALGFAQVRGGRNPVFGQPPVGAAPTSRGESYGVLPLTFEINRGQTDGAVKFLSRANGFVLFLTAGETVMVFDNPAAHDRGKERRVARESGNGRGPKPARSVVRMRLEGAAAAPDVEGLEELPGRSNYFGGDDPAQWQTSVEHYARVQYSQVYPGIDLVYYGNRRQLEYDFVVAPGGDPGLIRLNFSGPEKVEVSAGGDLLLRVAGGWLRQQSPVVYQEAGGVRHEIPSRYVLGDGNSVGFQVGAYDATRP